MKQKKEREQHEEAIYRLVYTTMDFLGDTLEAVKDYCYENGLDHSDSIWEIIRFKALREYGQDVKEALNR